jgi:hypothetical protein
MRSSRPDQTATAEALDKPYEMVPCAQNGTLNDQDVAILMFGVVVDLTRVSGLYGDTQICERWKADVTRRMALIEILGD